MERIVNVFKILLVAAIWKMLRELKIGKYVQVTRVFTAFILFPSILI